MSGRLCITCNAPYEKPHKKDCIRYVEPTYTREMIQRFMIDNGRKQADPKDGVLRSMMLSSDLDKLEKKYQ